MIVFAEKYSAGDRRWTLARRCRRIGLASAALLAIVSALLLAGAAAPARPPASAPDARGQAGAAVTFVPVDVYLDTGSSPLGAYQLEVESRQATIVGLEGGDAAAFKEAPYYDPAALQGSRIVVAALSTDDHLPAGLTRVARLHLMVTGAPASGDDKTGGGLPEMTEKLIVATDGQGKTVDAKLTLRPMQGELR